MCGLEFPDIEKQIWNPYADRGVQVLGVSGAGLRGEESEDTVRRFQAQTAVTFPLLLGDTTRKAFGKTKDRISPYPFDVIVGPDGTIAYIGTRFDRVAMTRVIEDLQAAGHRLAVRP